LLRGLVSRLIIGGACRFVRNPMYLALITAVLGQAMIFSSLALLLYTVRIWAITAAFVRWYEEPIRSGAMEMNTSATVRRCEPGYRGSVPGSLILIMSVARVDQ
jgi:Phospholipid methyltransferase